MTNNGKIARLPRPIRDELNQRLDNGETGNMILPWLNALPEVQAVLAAHFNAGAINHQNLTNWRQGGYLRWLNQHERGSLVRELAQNAGEIAPHGGGPMIARNLSTVLLADLAVSARDLQNELADPGERFDRLRELLHTVSEVRRDDHRATRLTLVQQRELLEARRSD